MKALEDRVYRRPMGKDAKGKQIYSARYLADFRDFRDVIQPGDGTGVHFPLKRSGDTRSADNYKEAVEIADEWVREFTRRREAGESRHDQSADDALPTGKPPAALGAFMAYYLKERIAAKTIRPERAAWLRNVVFPRATKDLHRMRKKRLRDVKSTDVER